MGKNKYCLTIILLFMSFLSFSQESQDTASSDRRTISIDELQGVAAREEVQRYFGYEDLLPRYLTIPYDMSMNTNESGSFVDIGFVLFIIFPILILAFFIRNTKAFSGILVALLLYLIICLPNAHLVDKSNIIRIYGEAAWNDIPENAQLSLNDKILVPFYNLTGTLYQPIDKVISSISGEKDSVTYSILTVLFLLALVAILRIKWLKEKTRILLLVLWTYSFLWLLLSAGIIWYGLLIFPMGYLLISRKDSLVNHLSRPVFQCINLLIIAVLFFWGAITYTSRTSNITPRPDIPVDQYGKAILNANQLLYTTGIYSAEQTTNSSYPNLSTAFEAINSDDKMVYMLGTSFTFDVKQNTTRLYTDNSLDQFVGLYRKFPNKETYIDVLKASDFKYIIVDLFIPTVDKSPEKTLITKFNMLLTTLYQNERIRLIATDRIVQRIDANGNPQQVYEVFGNIVNHGSFAVYEIL